jgi:hypothetical protein
MSYINQFANNSSGTPSPIINNFIEKFTINDIFLNGVTNLNDGITSNTSNGLVVCYAPYFIFNVAGKYEIEFFFTDENGAGGGNANTRTIYFSYNSDVDHFIYSQEVFGYSSGNSKVPIFEIGTGSKYNEVKFTFYGKHKNDGTAYTNNFYGKYNVDILSNATSLVIAFGNSDWAKLNIVLYFKLIRTI